VDQSDKAQFLLWKGSAMPNLPNGCCEDIILENFISDIKLVGYITEMEDRLFVKLISPDNLKSFMFVNLA
jgi:hypothetical protein